MNLSIQNIVRMLVTLILLGFITSTTFSLPSSDRFGGNSDFRPTLLAQADRNSTDAATPPSTNGESADSVQTSASETNPSEQGVTYPTRPIGIALLISGGGILGLGIGLTAVSASKEDTALSLYDNYSALFPPTGMPTYTEANSAFILADDERKTSNALRALSYVSYGVSGVAIGLGIFFFIKKGVSKPQETETISWGVYPMEDGTGTFITFRY